MAWIKTINQNEATGKLKMLYDGISSQRGGDVPNVLKAHSLNPDALESHLGLMKTVMFGESKLSLAQREMIGVVVSVANACEY